MAKELINRVLTGIGLGKLTRGSVSCNKTKELAQKNECINKPLENNPMNQLKNCLYGFFFKKCDAVKPTNNNCCPKPAAPVNHCKSSSDLLAKVKNLSCPANKKDILCSVKKKDSCKEGKKAEKRESCSPCPKKPPSPKKAKKAEKKEVKKADECDSGAKKAENCVPCPPNVGECDPCSKTYEPYDPCARNVRCPPRPRPPQPAHCIEKLPDICDCPRPCPRRTENKC